MMRFCCIKATHSITPFFLKTEGKTSAFVRSHSRGRGGGFFHSKGTWGCAARKGMLFKPSSITKGILFANFGPLAKGILFANFRPFSLAKGILFGNFGQRMSNFGNSYKETQFLFKFWSLE